MSRSTMPSRDVSCRARGVVVDEVGVRVGKRISGAAALAALALSLPLCSTAQAAATSTTTSTTSSSSSGQSTSSIVDNAPDADALTPEELARQIARAKALIEEITGSNSEIADLTDKLQKATTKANAALEAYSTADQAEQDATAEAKRQQDLADALQEKLDQGRRDLRAFAVEVYTQGGSLAESMSYIDALSKNASQLSNPLSDLNFLTDSKIRTVEQLREVAVAQKLASMNAESARSKAKDLADKAKETKDAAKKAVEESTVQLDALRTAHQKHIAEAGPLAGLLLGSGSPDAAGAAAALNAALKDANVPVTSLKLTPCTDKTGNFSNGQIPPSALCPLVGSPDEVLIPDAAAAFNAMSKAYAEETGHLICVTDGYRSYAEQVVLKAQKGKWAATPGTSEHGWGKAVDLCGGIQDFSSPAHLWMVQNAPRFGWFHPAWAEAGGSLPEPWHWEFGDS